MRLYLLGFLLVVSACDGTFGADGRVVDAKGAPVAGARVSTRNKSFETDESGCFHVFEITDRRRHLMPFRVEGPGLNGIAGDLPSPGSIRVRVILSLVVGTFAEAVSSDPAAGALGPCEPGVGRR